MPLSPLNFEIVTWQAPNAGAAKAPENPRREKPGAAADRHSFVFVAIRAQSATGMRVTIRVPGQRAYFGPGNYKTAPASRQLGCDFLRATRRRSNDTSAAQHPFTTMLRHFGDESAQRKSRRRFRLNVIKVATGWPAPCIRTRRSKIERIRSRMGGQNQIEGASVSPRNFPVDECRIFASNSAVREV
jgi:hypothetical protein